MTVLTSSGFVPLGSDMGFTTHMGNSAPWSNAYRKGAWCPPHYGRRRDSTGAHNMTRCTKGSFIALGLLGRLDERVTRLSGEERDVGLALSTQEH